MSNLNASIFSPAITNTSPLLVLTDTRKLFIEVVSVNQWTGSSRYYQIKPDRAPADVQDATRRYDGGRIESANGNTYIWYRSLVM